jgi:hypothetical protein
MEAMEGRGRQVEEHHVHEALENNTLLVVVHPSKPVAPFYCRCVELCS